MVSFDTYSGDVIPLCIQGYKNVGSERGHAKPHRRLSLALFKINDLVYNPIKQDFWWVYFSILFACA